MRRWEYNVLITHGWLLLKDICDRVAIMEGGYRGRSKYRGCIQPTPSGTLDHPGLHRYGKQYQKIYDLIEDKMN